MREIKKETLRKWRGLRWIQTVSLDFLKSCGYGFEIIFKKLKLLRKFKRYLIKLENLNFF